jgi:hypothetical protein
MQTTSSGSQSDLSQSVSVRLLRLSRPQLQLTSSLVDHLTKHCLANEFPNASNSRQSLFANGEHVVQPYLTLPATFGNIFLGEPLSFVIMLKNESTQESTRINLMKVELQSASTRALVLEDHPSDLLPIEGTQKFIVKQEIKEVGMHILVVQVQYTEGSQSDSKFLRKFYKFQVLNPFQVKTKPQAAPFGRTILELSVQNTSASGLELSRLGLTPNDKDFSIRDFCEVKSAQIPTLEKEALFSSSFFQPNDVRQYLYLFSPKRINANLAPLGKLEIEWEGAHESGRLQTPPLPQKQVAPQTQGLDLLYEVIESPQILSMGKEAEIVLKITNQTKLVVSLQVEFQIPTGQSDSDYKKLKSSMSKTFSKEGDSILVRSPTSIADEKRTSRPSSAQSFPHEKYLSPRPGSAQNAPGIPNFIFPNEKVPSDHLLIIGSKSYQLGDLNPANSIHWSIRIAGLRKGFLYLSPLRFSDTYSGASREFNPQLSIFVS